MARKKFIHAKNSDVVFSGGRDFLAERNPASGGAGGLWHGSGLPAGHNGQGRTSGQAHAGTYKVFYWLASVPPKCDVGIDVGSKARAVGDEGMVGTVYG